MRRMLFLAAAAVAALTLGAGALAHAGSHRIAVAVAATTGEPGARQTRAFTLTCNPSGGSLPFAARVCKDITLHPKAMLRPPKPGAQRTTIVCSGGPSMPLVSVHTHSDGRTRRFSGSPGCDWPGNQAIAVYFDAASHDVSSLSMSESELRCDEDPTLLAVPTPLQSVVACRHGLWTAHAERLIRVAAGATELAGLGAARLFPRDVGALPCAIHSGGAFPGRRLAGVCGVRITSPWSTATVTLTERWTNAPGKSARHIWRVTIRRNHVIGVSQSGAAPPQTWP